MRRLDRHCGQQSARLLIYNNNTTDGQHENGNMMIENEETEYELSLAVGHIDKDEIESINESLKDMGFVFQ
jgi:hypothetical protein